MSDPERIPAALPQPVFYTHVCKCGVTHELTHAAPPHDLCWACHARTYEGRSPEDRAREMEACIPERFRWARFDDGHLLARRVPDANARLAAASKLDTTMVIFVGLAGEGKTALAIARMRAWHWTTKKAALFVDARELCGARSRHALGDGDAALMDTARRTGLLVIDDLGGELASGLSRGEIDDIVVHRTNAMSPLWTTTQLTKEMLHTRYGEGIARRLLEGSTVIRVGR